MKTIQQIVSASSGLSFSRTDGRLLCFCSDHWETVTEAHLSKLLQYMGLFDVAVICRHCQIQFPYSPEEIRAMKLDIEDAYIRNPRENSIARDARQATLDAWDELIAYCDEFAYT